MKLNCYDGMSFGAGRIVLREDTDSYELLLRGYPSHGRLARDLAKDLGVSEASQNRMAWVGVRIKKSECSITADPRPVAACHGSEADVTFYEGWQVSSLQLLKSLKAEASSIIDQATLRTLAPNSFPDSGTVTEVETTKGSVVVTAPGAYRVTASAQIASVFFLQTK